MAMQTGNARLRTEEVGVLRENYLGVCRLSASSRYRRGTMTDNVFAVSLNGRTAILKKIIAQAAEVSTAKAGTRSVT